MNLKQILLTWIMIIGILPLSYAQNTSYDWLDEVLSESCCANQTATEYDFGEYSFIYIEGNENCAPNGKLYFEDGKCWCEDIGGTFCLEFYNIASVAGEVIYECEESPTTFTPFDQFPWLESVASKDNCELNPSISVYLRDGHYYIFVEDQNGLGQLYYDTGAPMCTSQSNYDCVAMYGFTNKTMSWTCGDVTVPNGPQEGTDIILRNTLQDPGEAEATYASLFGLADDAFDEFATFSNTVSEFPTALSQSPATGAPFDISGLYDIDITENSIEFTVLPGEDDPFWSNVFGLFPDGKFDRYYFTFSEPHNITSASSNNPSVNLRIDSETVVVVEISEGYDLQPGVSFTVNLNPPPSIVIEVTLFDLNEGVDSDVFKARDLEIEQEFASQQPGFLKRLSGVDANGQYVVMVFWETLADADASIAAFGMDPTVADYFAMINGSTFSAERYTTFAVPDIAFTMVENNVIEITTFNLNAGVNPAVFVARDAEIEQDFASLQPGFIRRTSGVDANGKYAVIVFWESLADADASIAAFGMDPTVGDYFAMIDGATFAADRYTIFDDIPSPLQEGMDITMRNTLQDAGEAEATYASLFGQPDDAYDEFAILSNTTSEFPTALAQSGTPAGDINGLYDIDFTENSIEFTVLPGEDDPFWSNVFGLFPDGKFDRYYFTFSEPHNVTSFTSDNPNLNLRIDSETVIVVELTGGYDVQPGVSFTVNLNMAEELNNIVVEVTTFNLNDGVDPSVFEARDAEIEQDFASVQPGFLKRMSAVDADGKYVIMVFWETLADADASIAAFGVDPTVGDYFAMIDGSTFSAERYTTFSIPDINFELMEENVIEITTFNLNDGVEPAVFEARDAEIEQDFASLQPGFIRRTSGVDANGKYAVIVFWNVLADADASIAAFQVDPTVSDYFGMINGSTFIAERFEILK